jgi:hypothetical protein
MYDYIHLHYTKQDGSKAVFRASPRHGIVLPTQAIPSSNPLPAPGPGTLKQMQMVVVSYKFRELPLPYSILHTVTM